LNKLIYIIIICFISINLNSENIKIGFGSCIQDPKAEKIWNSINKLNLDYFFLLGDAVYLDNKDFKKGNIQRKYDLLFENNSFINFKKNINNFHVIWDDHDIGLDNHDNTFPKQNLARKYFLKNWGISKINKVIDSDDSRFILTDNRSFKNNKKKTFFGSSQIDWIINSVKESKSKYNFIISGGQIISKNDSKDCFCNSKKEYKKLLKFLNSTNKNIIILSGDKHYAEVVNFKKNVIEFTSSSLTGNMKKEATESKFVFNKVNNFGVIELVNEKEVIAKFYDENLKEIYKNKIFGEK